MNKNTYNLPALSNEGGLAAYLAQIKKFPMLAAEEEYMFCLLYTSPSPRDKCRSRMPSSA